MITVTFQVYDSYGPIEEFIREMPTVPREGEMVRMCGFHGPISKVTWLPGDEAEDEIYAIVKVHV